MGPLSKVSITVLVMNVQYCYRKENVDQTVEILNVTVDQELIRKEYSIIIRKVEQGKLQSQPPHATEYQGNLRYDACHSIKEQEIPS